MILVLGVVDVAYSDANGGDATKTTGDVAEGLEERYQPMATFFESRKEKIAGILADSMANSLEVLFQTGNPIPPDSVTLTYEGDQKIEAEFRAFIYSNEMAIAHKLLTGDDLSAAASAVVNHRKKHPYAKANKARPAFVDTGLYVQSFRAWTKRSP